MILGESGLLRLQYISTFYCRFTISCMKKVSCFFSELSDKVICFTHLFVVRHYARSGFAFTEKSPNRFRSTHAERNAQSMRQVWYWTVSQHISNCSKQGFKQPREHFGVPNDTSPSRLVSCIVRTAIRDVRNRQIQIQRTRSDLAYKNDQFMYSLESHPGCPKWPDPGLAAKRRVDT